MTKKSRTFPGPMKHFPGPVWSPWLGHECLNIKKKQHLISSCNTWMQCVWNAKGGKIHQHSTLYLCKQLLTQTGCHDNAACYPFEPLEKCMIFEDIFRGLSRSWNFQGKKSSIFQEAWEPWHTNGTKSEQCIVNYTRVQINNHCDQRLFDNKWVSPVPIGLDWAVFYVPANKV